MESLQNALTHGFSIAMRISYKVFQSAVLKALFIIDEDHLELAIEQDVDLLALFLIYAPQWVKYSQGIAKSMAAGVEHKVTLPTSLKWLKQQCTPRKRRYYDIIVNLPADVAGSNPIPAGSNPAPPNPDSEVFPPPGADEKRVQWYWGNVQRLTAFVFHNTVPEPTKRYAIMHLKWLKEQQDQGKTKLGDLLEAAKREADSKST